MNEKQQNDRIALTYINRFQNKIQNARSGMYSNQKRLAIYWMCTDICEKTKYFMNSGLSQLFNQLHKNGWTNFACTPDKSLRYGFRFTKGSKISLTAAGKKELTALKPTVHRQNQAA